MQRNLRKNIWRPGKTFWGFNFFVTKELNKKLLEEVNEYLSDNNIEELADIKEVFLAILKAKGISDEELELVRLDKVSKRGSFNDKIFLEYEE